MARACSASAACAPIGSGIRTLSVVAIATYFQPQRHRERRGNAEKSLIVFLCAISVPSASLWFMFFHRSLFRTAETQRTQRQRREISHCFSLRNLYLLCVSVVHVFSSQPISNRRDTENAEATQRNLSLFFSAQSLCPLRLCGSCFFIAAYFEPQRHRERRGNAEKSLIVFLCAISVPSASLWFMFFTESYPPD